MFMIENCRITYIYGLYEVGKEDEIRYVGKSDNPSKRLKSHIEESKRGTSYKSTWIRSGGNIDIIPIKVVNVIGWESEEIKLISEYRKIYKLTNYTDGGTGGMSNIYYKSYDECVRWLIDNRPDIKKMKDYKIWSKTEGFPEFLPIAPNRFFKDTWKLG